jgi:transcriptional regulator with XRE-family HTH domain
LKTTHREFGRHLRDERERRGLVLQAIADSTKVPLSLLAGLERGDIQDWPSGLFGRAHLRAYAVAVGLPPEPLLNEFLQLSGNDAAPTQALSTLTPDEGLRLTLAEDRRWDIRSIGMRALAVALDGCGIVAIAAVLARLLPADLSLTCALVTLVYYSLTTMALGQSVTLWWLGGRVLQRTIRSTANARNVLLMPRRALRASPRQEGPVDFRDNSSEPVAHAASR